MTTGGVSDAKIVTYEIGQKIILINWFEYSQSNAGARLR
jgi:hypothetical protein